MKVANGCGFWGDDLDAPRRLLEQARDIDYLTLDYLAEVSLSIMAIQKEKNPELGYARDFISVVESLVSYWKKGGKCKIITNGGGLNPDGLAKACRIVLEKAGLSLKIAVITGDDVLEQMQDKNLVTANAYLGAKPIAVALDLGADIVIAGRIADPSLTVGPCLYHYKWPHDAYNQIAGATVAGHLIECGTQVTGGISTDWLDVPDVKNMGYPIAEIMEDGSCIITKPESTGGAVTLRTVKEQLLYEITDPANYKSPDVTVSFLALQVKEVGLNRICVQGALGAPPPSTLKVSTTYRAGFKAVGQLAFFGENVVLKAKKTGEMILAKVALYGYELEKSLIEIIGAGAVVPVIAPYLPLECLLRISVRDSRKEALEVFIKEIAPAVTSGPQGTTGYLSGRPEIRPVFGYSPSFIEANQLKINIHLDNGGCFGKST